VSSPDPFAGLLALPDVFEAMEAARSAVDTALRHDRIRRQHDPEVTAAALAAAAAASARLDRLDPAAGPLVRLTAETAPLARTVTRAPLQAVTRMHLLAGGADPGRPRAGADTARLAGLARRLTAPTQAPALLVAAVAHGELLAVAPFADRNGPVARQLARAIITGRALDPKAVTVPEAGHWEESAR
jgi:hypothetical protein